jgi:hypothetical protein
VPGSRKVAAANTALVVAAAVACRNLEVADIALLAHKVVTHKARHKAAEEAVRAGCNPADQEVRIVR